MDIELFDKKYVYLEWSDKLEGKDCIIAKTYKDLKDFVNSADEGRIFKVYKGTEKPFTNHWKDCDFCYFDPNLAVKKALIEGKEVQYYSCFDKWEDLDLIGTSIEDYLDNEDWDEYEWRVKPSSKIESAFFVNIHFHNMFELEISTNNNCAIFRGTKEQCVYIIKKVDCFIHDNCVCRCKYKGSNCHNCTKLLDFIKGIEFKITRRMTNRELSQWLAKGNGEMKNFGYGLFNISTCHCYADVAENENVDRNILIRDFGSDEWREPLIEV